MGRGVACHIRYCQQDTCHERTDNMLTSGVSGVML